MVVDINGTMVRIIRTVSSWVVAWLISLPIAGEVLGALGVDSVTARNTLVGLLVVVLGTLYYLLVTLLEHKWPKLGILLGVPTKPVYDSTPTVVASPVVTSDKDAVSKALSTISLPADPSYK